jgi:hypothetical protein
MRVRAPLVVVALLASTAVSAQIRRPPPPSAVRVSEIQPVDTLRGSFVVEWTPAFWLWTPTPTILQSYVLSSKCEYEGLPSGGTIGVTYVGAQYLYTGPPYKVRAVCGCRQRINYTITTEAPLHLDPYSGRSQGVFLLARVPCATPDRR